MNELQARLVWNVVFSILVGLLGVCAGIYEGSFFETPGSHTVAFIVVIGIAYFLAIMFMSSHERASRTIVILHAATQFMGLGLFAHVFFLFRGSESLWTDVGLAFLYFIVGGFFLLCSLPQGDSEIARKHFSRWVEEDGLVRMHNPTIRYSKLDHAFLSVPIFGIFYGIWRTARNL